MKTKKPILPDELIQEILRDNCVAYIGSGLSVGAGLPIWKTLLELMVEWCKSRQIKLPAQKELKKLFRENNFLLLADILTKRMGKGEYHDFLVSIFRRDGLVSTENHHLLPQIPFISVLTTNYDKLIESAYTTFNNGASPHVFTQLDRTEIARALHSKEFHILKTHGDIDRLESLVLTFSDYRSLMYANEAYRLYLQNIFTSKTVLFLGFSLTDPDLMGLLNGVREIFGDDTPRHYALMDVTKLSKSEQEHFRDNYGIRIIGYRPSSPPHPEVTEFLQQLVSRIPPRAQMYLQKSQEEFDKLDSHFTVIPTGKGEFGIFEKYPGASDDKPLQIEFKIKVDKSPEGQAAKQAYTEFDETGEMTKFTPEQVLDWKLPEFISKAMGMVFDQVEITMGTSSDGEIRRVNVIVLNDDGESETLEHIELEPIADGKKRTRWNNEKQSADWKIELIEDLRKGRTSITFEFMPLSSNVYQLYRNWKFAAALAKGGQVAVEDKERGINIFESRLEPGGVPAPKPGLLKLLEDLVFIQKRIGTPLTLPKRFPSTEINVIETTIQILKTGKIEGAFAFNVRIETNRFRKFLSQFEEEEEIPFEHYEADYSTVIFGERLFLGAAWLEVKKLPFPPQTRETWQQKLAEVTNEFVTIKFQFNPAADAALYFLDWLKPEEANDLAQKEDLRRAVLQSIVKSLIDATKSETGEIDKNLLESYFRAALEVKPQQNQPLTALAEFTEDEFSTIAKENLPVAEAAWILSIYQEVIVKN